jgi:hypothetical protein
MLPGAMPVIAGGSLPVLVKGSFYSNTANQTTYTFTAVDIGTQSADRLVVIGTTSTETGVNRTFSSATIDGSAATVNAAVAAASFIPTAIFSRNVTSGTTTDITITYSGGVTNCAIKIYLLYGLQSFTPVGSGQLTVVSGASQSLSFNTSNNGIVIFACSKGNGGDTTFSSATRDEHQLVESRRHAYASIAPSAALTPLTETASFTNSANGIGFVGASWR